MLEKVIDTATHGYQLGKRCAISANKYSPHHSLEFVWACDDFRNHLPVEEKKCDSGEELTLHFVDVWRMAFELGVEEVRRERVLVETLPVPTVKVKRYGKRKTGKTAVDLSKVDWV